MNTTTFPIQCLDADAINTIRAALLIGLTCYGEIEERINAQELYQMSGEKLPSDLIVLHPTGCCSVPAKFAAALNCLEVLT